MTILENILRDVRDELAAARAACPPAELRRMLGDAPPVRALDAALEGEFGLIAEIKKRSPSVGAMREENVKQAPEAYEASPVVKALSILTNFTHFGMSVRDLAEMRQRSAKPLLRKDFLVDEYQVREARVQGADAVLLMANVLDAAQLQGFYDLARELGMQALFEVHEEEEIGRLPKDARLVGINSRKFRAVSGFAGAHGHSDRDFSLDFSAFELAGRLPKGVLRVAESGLSPANLPRVRQSFHAALVGTSLLRDARGVAPCLNEFEAAILNSPEPVATAPSAGCS